MSDDASCERVVIEIRRHTLQAQPDGAIRLSRRVAVELVEVLGDVESK
jgi:hypothetical protein